MGTEILRIHFCSIRAFARVDAVVVSFSVLLLAVVGWAGVGIGGKKWQALICAHHMKTLGQAFTEYAQDQDGALPPAVAINGTNSTSWDKEIAVYLEPALAGQNSVEKQKELETKTAYHFKCPSDHMPRRGGPPRSYAMPMYDINHFGWPPDANSQGGVGLYLDAKTLQEAAARNAMPPAIKISMVPSPANTALLVECFNNLNALWRPKMACLSSSGDQWSGKTSEAKDFHGGKMNYLMLDGHVELLSSQTLALLPSENADYPGLWTIKGGY